MRRVAGYYESFTNPTTGSRFQADIHPQLPVLTYFIYKWNAIIIVLWRHDCTLTSVAFSGSQSKRNCIHEHVRIDCKPLTHILHPIYWNDRYGLPPSALFYCDGDMRMHDSRRGFSGFRQQVPRWEPRNCEKKYHVKCFTFLRSSVWINCPLCFIL